MATMDTIVEAAEANRTVEFDYAGEHRVVSPTDILNGSIPGTKVLVGVQETKGWRRFTLDEIENIHVGSKAHSAPDENTFV